MVQLFSAWGVLADVQLRRSLCLPAGHRLAPQTTSQAEYAYLGTALHARLACPRRGDRDVPATSGRHCALPLPGHQDPLALVERADTGITRTSGVNTWRAGCGESRMSGSEGGPGKPTSRKAGRAPWSDPYTDDRFAFTRNTQAIPTEAAMDGLYVIATTVAPEQMTAAKVVATYKSLSRVERDFRSLKAIDVDLRPIHHHTQTRVRAHVFICMLAAYLAWHLRARGRR